MFVRSFELLLSSISEYQVVVCDCVVWITTQYLMSDADQAFLILAIVVIAQDRMVYRVHGSLDSSWGATPF